LRATGTRLERWQRPPDPLPTVPSGPSNRGFGDVAPLFYTEKNKIEKRSKIGQFGTPKVFAQLRLLNQGALRESFRKMQKLMNQFQIAIALRVHGSLVYRAVESGRIKPDATTTNGQPLFDSSQIDELRRILLTDFDAGADRAARRAAAVEPAPAAALPAPIRPRQVQPEAATNRLAELLEAGNYAEAFLHLSAKEKADFGNAKTYAAYMRAERGGRAKLYGPGRNSTLSSRG
jgi:hypothetical protein